MVAGPSYLGSYGRLLCARCLLGIGVGVRGRGRGRGRGRAKHSTNPKRI